MVDIKMISRSNVEVACIIPHHCFHRHTSDIWEEGDVGSTIELEDRELLRMATKF